MKKSILSICFSVIVSSLVFAHGTDVTFKFTLGGNDLQLNTEYTVHGTRVKFTKIQFYISNLRFIKADSTEEVENVIVCPVAGVDSMVHFHLSSVPHGDYTGLKFDIGLDSATNHSDPSTYPSSNPLSSGNPHIGHWSWNSGYVFIKVEGLVDSSQTQNQTIDQPMEMHLGGDANKVTVDIRKNFSIVHGGDAGMEIILELNELLHDLDLKYPAERITHTMDNMMLANHLKSHIPMSFDYEKLVASIYEIGNAGEINLSVYPNPAEDVVTILFDNGDSKPFQFSITDLSGKKILERNVNDNSIEISLPGLSKGLYIVNLVSETKLSYNSKLIVK